MEAATSLAPAHHTVLALTGELCLAELPGVRDRIEAAVEAGATTLVIDLAATTLVTAAALRVFESAGQRLEAQGGALVLRNPAPLARRVLEITGLDRLLEPCPAA